MQERATKSLIAGLIGLAIVVGIMLVCVCIVQLCSLKKIKKQTTALENEYEQILARKESTKEAIEKLEGNEFVESYAREILGYVKPGEIKFVAKD